MRGAVAHRAFIAFWCRAGRVVAAMNVNVWDVADAPSALIRSGRRVRAAELADPDVALAGPAAAGRDPS